MANIIDKLFEGVYQQSRQTVIKSQKKLREWDEVELEGWDGGCFDDLSGEYNFNDESCWESAANFIHGSEDSEEGPKEWPEDMEEDVDGCYAYRAQPAEKLVADYNNGKINIWDVINGIFEEYEGIL